MRHFTQSSYFLILIFIDSCRETSVKSYTGNKIFSIPGAYYLLPALIKFNKRFLTIAIEFFCSN